jgi:hypothetical protein
VPDFKSRGRTQWRAPAEPAGDVAEPEQKCRERPGHVCEARLPPAEPTPEVMHDIGKGQPLRTGEIEREPGRRARHEKKHNRRDDILELHDLQCAGIGITGSTGKAASPRNNALPP